MSIKIGQKDLEQVYMGNADGVRKEVKAIYGNVDGSIKLLWKKYPTAAYEITSLRKTAWYSPNYCIDGDDNTLAVFFTYTDSEKDGIKFIRVSPKKVKLSDIEFKISDILESETGDYPVTSVTNANGLTLLIVDTRHNYEDSQGVITAYYGERLISFDGKTGVTTDRGEISGKGTIGLRAKCCAWQNSNGSVTFYGGGHHSGHGWNMKNTMVTISESLVATFTNLSSLAVVDDKREKAQAIVRNDTAYIIGGSESVNNLGEHNSDYAMKVAGGVVTQGPVLNSTERYQRPTFSVLDKTGVIWACGGVSGSNYNNEATATRTVCKIAENDVVTLVENGCPDSMIGGEIDGNGNIQMGTDAAIYQYRYNSSTGTYTTLINTDTTALGFKNYKCFSDASGEILCLATNKQIGSRWYSDYGPYFVVWPKLKNK